MIIAVERNFMPANLIEMHCIAAEMKAATGML